MNPRKPFSPANGFAMRERKPVYEMEDSDLDLRGLKCPLPALMARRKLAALSPGTTLWVLASDPLSVVDIPHMCAEEGHALIEKTAHPDHHRFLIRRRG
jgi:tRNA 2-thiouridine synthesizing protein A